MTKIILIGAAIAQNFGGPSVLLSTCKVLDAYFPSAEYTLISTIQENDGLEKDKIIARKLGMNVYARPTPFQTLIILVYSIFSRLYPGFVPPDYSNSAKLFRELKKSDILIDIWGIVYADELDYGFFRSAYNGMHYIIGKMLKMPVIKYTADIGPFNHYWNRIFGIFYLNMADLIIGRSEETKNLITKAGITTPVIVCPDTAFLLPTTQNLEYQDILSKNINNSLIIGISVSRTIEKKEKQIGIYAEVMAKLADYLITEYDARIVLIPNEIFAQREDDIFTAQEIHNLIQHKNNVILISKEYFAPELKGIIELCDIMIAARYHSIVASLSLGIPTLAISWHHKYPEIMDLFGQRKFTCSIDELTPEIIISLFDELWKNKDLIHIVIDHKGEKVKESIWKGGERVKSLYEGNNL